MANRSGLSLYRAMDASPLLHVIHQAGWINMAACGVYLILRSPRLETQHNNLCVSVCVCVVEEVDE